MSLSIGIVGLPNVGKSTLFNAITKQSVQAENFPFCTIEPSVGIVQVPDERLQALAKMSNSAKIIPATVEFIDIAGLVSGASKGEGLGNQFLANIRECDAVAQVVRVFEDENTVHIHGSIDPKRDIDVINLELILADMQTASKAMEKLSKHVKSGDKNAIAKTNVIEKIIRTLETGKLANETILTIEEKKSIKDLNLITLKPFMYILNIKNDAINITDNPSNERAIRLRDFLSDSSISFVEVDAGVENEMKDVHQDDQMDFRREFGILKNGVNELIKKSYDLLNLISFFTTGKKETRSWTIKRGSTAPQAGGAIHTDFQNKFIRAQVIKYDTLLQSGSWQNAKESGLIRTEGKEYIVKDGDVIEFMHS